MRIRTIINKRILLLLSCVIITGFLFIGIFFLLQPGKGRIYPINGQLDMENWNLEQDSTISLSGGWDFYWQKLLTYQDLKRNPVPDLKVKVPEVWNQYRIKGKKLPGFGYATYRIRVVNVPKGKPLALRIPVFLSAYKLYIDSELVSANGKVASSRRQYSPQYLPRIVEFTPAGTSFEMIVQVANFTYTRGGLWYRMVMGTPEQIRSIYRTASDKDLLLIGALAVMALYYLGIFLLRPKDKSSLYFALICLMFVSRTAVFGDYFLYRLPAAIRYQAIIMIACIILVWFPNIAFLFVNALFPEETSTKFLKAVLVYGAMIAMIFLLTPIFFYSRFLYPVLAISLVISFYTIVCLMKAFLNRRKDAMLVLIGSLAMIISAGRVMSYQNNLILCNYGNLVQDGLFVLLIMQSFILARRFSVAFHNVEALSQKLLKLDKVKDEFLANTSHELRTPLSGILSITEAMLRGSDGKITRGQRQKLSLIAGSSRRLTNLVNDILDFSKLKHGDIPLNIKPVRLDGVIQTVVNVFQQVNKSGDYEIIADIPPGLSAALADENRVIQILYNLIGNALKFTTRGYIKVSVKITGAMLEVCVCDTGEGIPGDKLEDIFKSFEQVDTSLTRKYGGTGLGLSITKQLVELQGGSLWVKSTLGIGSEFYFTLPLAGETPLENEAGLALPELASTVLKEQSLTLNQTVNGTHILLVDDDPINLQSSATLLKIGGYSVTTVNRGKSALTEIERNHDYSLVILDVMMPELSGYEVCRKIRESRSHFELPVLMLTARTAVSDIVVGFQAGANDYLPKPFEPEELLARVGTLVNLKKSVDKTVAAEVAFMQAQIKPHFLYNTLNTISCFCDTDPGQAQRLIDQFSNYLRQSFDFKNPAMYVSISNEISLVKSYIEIEKARFGDKLTIKFDMDEVGQVKIPPLTIQPLVENAIHHGIRKKGGSGKVTVTLKKTAQGILVSVEDDGSGILPEKMEQIFTPDSSRSVGLWNIDSRLKKLFGTGLTIASESGKGVQVTFIIPPEVS